MKKTLGCILTLAGFSLFSGCVVVSLHSTRPVEARVTEKETGGPVSEASLETIYSYDSYGVFHILRAPEPEYAKTDGRGIAVLPIADFSQSIILQVNGERFRLNKKLVRNGGLLRDGWSVGPGTGYEVHLTPER